MLIWQAGYTLQDNNYDHYIVLLKLRIQLYQIYHGENIFLTMYLGCCIKENISDTLYVDCLWMKKLTSDIWTHINVENSKEIKKLKSSVSCSSVGENTLLMPGVRDWFWDCKNCISPDNQRPHQRPWPRWKNMKQAGYRRRPPHMGGAFYVPGL